MLWTLESNAKPLSKEKLDSLKQLEGKITIVITGNEINITNTKFKNDNIARLIDEHYRLDGISIFNEDYDFYYTKNNKFYTGYFLLFNEIEQGQYHKYYGKSVEEVLLEMDKIHLKGKVGLLDNLVPIKWI